MQRGFNSLMLTAAKKQPDNFDEILAAKVKFAYSIWENVIQNTIYKSPSNCL